MTRAARGFTLIEMAMVLLIIAIGSALVVPMIEGGFDSREVRRAARQIAATMHYCRGEAVAVGKPQELVIVQATNAIQTTGGRQARASRESRAVRAARAAMDALLFQPEIRDHTEERTSGEGYRIRMVVRHAGASEGLRKSELGFESELSLRYLQVDVAWEDGIGVKTYTLKSLRAAPEND